jgi:hypothetical protein
MARLDDCGGQQRDHLRDRDAHRAIWVRARQPVLHGTLREQSVELAKQETIKTQRAKEFACAYFASSILFDWSYFHPRMDSGLIKLGLWFSPVLLI